MNNRQCEMAKKNLRDKVVGLSLNVGRQTKTFYLCRQIHGNPDARWANCIATGLWVSGRIQVAP